MTFHPSKKGNYFYNKHNNNFGYEEKNQVMSNDFFGERSLKGDNFLKRNILSQFHLFIAKLQKKIGFRGRVSQHSYSHTHIYEFSRK
jgi:hypothetical protein